MVDRVSKLAQILKSEGVDAYLACTPVSMGYLAELFEDGHERLLIMAVRDDGQVRLICPALTANQAKRVGIADIRPWADGEDPANHLRELAQDWRLSTGILAVDSEMRADILLSLQTAWPAALFKSGEPLLSQLTRRKDSAEIELLRRAGAIADRAYVQVKTQLRAGLTELEVSSLLANAMKELGGKPTFSIVATGPNGAEPHHLSDETKLQSGDVVVLDFGCSVDGYQSDITRVVAIDSTPEEANGVYEIVHRAHMAGRAAARAGARTGEVDRACRRVIEAAGYGEFFIHRTGHGIGMRGHEAPYLGPDGNFVLEAGNTFSVEPGIYLPGRFGVRIENIVAATAEVCQSLNDEPSPALEIVGQS
jgi:Xaa-Pro dipeptidase